MRRYITELLGKTLIGLARRMTNLERELLGIVSDCSPIDKQAIATIIDSNYPCVFSMFEIEYTIDRMVRDGKIKAHRQGYIVPSKK
jgi:hypothetical protein